MALFYKHFYRSLRSNTFSYKFYLSTVVETPGINANEAETLVSKPKRKAAKELVKDPLNIYVAVQKVKDLAWAKFDETVELAINLNVDPRKPNMSIKGVSALPHGTGKKVKVAVFTRGSNVQAAIDAGADIVGAEDLIEKVQSGDFSFDRVIASPDVMPILGKIGKILGPRGLMPNPKLGTVTTDIAKAVKAAKAGSVQFRVEKQGIVHAGVGKVSFSDEALLDNIRSFLIAIGDSKPEGFKGKYISAAHICSTMGPGITLDVASIDPTSPKFMLNPALLASQT